MDEFPQLFALVYTPGPNYQQDQQQGEHELEQHDSYIKDLRAKHKVKQGGSFRDKRHGAPIIEARDEVEARDAAERDPAVKSGVLEVQVLPWNIVFGTKSGI